MVQKRVDQSAVQIAGRRVHDHAGGLFHNQQVIVLEDDLQRDILGFIMGRGRGGNLHLIGSPGLRLGCRIADCRAGGVQDVAGADESLEPFAGQGGHGSGKRPVQPPAGLVGGQ
jgi:hypothetical protein